MCRQLVARYRGNGPGAKGFAAGAGAGGADVIRTGAGGRGRFREHARPSGTPGGVAVRRGSEPGRVYAAVARITPAGRRRLTSGGPIPFVTTSPAGYLRR